MKFARAFTSVFFWVVLIGCGTGLGLQSVALQTWIGARLDRPASVFLKRPIVTILDSRSNGITAPLSEFDVSLVREHISAANLIPLGLGERELTYADRGQVFTVGVVQPNFFASLQVKDLAGIPALPVGSAVIGEDVLRRLSIPISAALGSVIAISGRPYTIAAVAPAVTQHWGDEDIQAWIVGDGAEFFKSELDNVGESSSGTASRLLPRFYLFVTGESAQLLMIESLLRSVEPKRVREVSVTDEAGEKQVLSFEANNRTLHAFEGAVLRPEKSADVRRAAAAFLAVTTLLALVGCANLGFYWVSVLTNSSREARLHAVVGSSPGRMFTRYLGWSLVAIAVAGALSRCVYIVSMPLVSDVLRLGAALQQGAGFSNMVGLAVAVCVFLVFSISVGIFVWTIYGRSLVDTGNRLTGGLESRRWRGAMLALQFAGSIGVLALCLLLMGDVNRFAESDWGVATKDRYLVDVNRIDLIRAPLADRLAHVTQGLKEYSGGMSLGAAGTAAYGPTGLGDPSRATLGSVSTDIELVGVTDGFVDVSGLSILQRVDPMSRGAIVSNRVAKLLGGDILGKDVNISIYGMDMPFRIVAVLAPSHDDSDRVFIPSDDPNSMVVEPSRLVVHFPSGLLSIAETRGAITEAARVAGFNVSGIVRASDAFALKRSDVRRLILVLEWASLIAMLVLAGGSAAFCALEMSRREKELAIRHVLGAGRRNILALVLGDIPMVVGIAVVVSGSVTCFTFQRWNSLFQESHAGDVLLALSASGVSVALIAVMMAALLVSLRHGRHLVRSLSV